MTATTQTPDATPTANNSTQPKRAAKQAAPELSEAMRGFFARPGPKLIAALWLASVIARGVIGQWSMWDLAIFGGILAFWPFQEWLIHVFILHFKPRQIGSITIDPFVSNKHRRHHADPWDLDICFTPMRGIFIVVALNVLGWWAFMPTTALAVTGFTTYMTFGLLYEWTHYLVHTRYRPKSKLYKHIWKNHRLHHCKNENYWYGVSMTAGDYILRTAPDQREVETSPTCKSVHPQR